MTSTDAPADLIIEDLVIGDGAVATGPGQFVTVHYTDWLVDDAIFDSRVKRNEPFGFPLGGGIRHFRPGSGCGGHARRRPAQTHCSSNWVTGRAVPAA